MCESELLIDCSVLILFLKMDLNAYDLKNVLSQWPLMVCFVSGSVFGFAIFR